MWQVLVLTKMVTCSDRIAALMSTCHGDIVKLNLVNICIEVLNIYFESFLWSQNFLHQLYIHSGRPLLVNS